MLRDESCHLPYGAIQLYPGTPEPATAATSPKPTVVFGLHCRGRIRLLQLQLNVCSGRCEWTHRPE